MWGVVNSPCNGVNHAHKGFLLMTGLVFLPCLHQPEV